MYENNSHIIYSAAEIRRYLNGEMTRDEMYALEKQAAEDPFLADAIEGYNGITIEAAEADLALLRSKLNKEEDKRDAKVVPMNTPGGFKWWKQGIAAAVAGLVIFAAAMFLRQNKKAEELAVNTSTEKSEIKPAPGSESAGKTDALNETPKLTEPKKTAVKPVFIHPDSLVSYYSQTEHIAGAGVEKLTTTGAPGGSYRADDKYSRDFGTIASGAVADSAKQRVVSEGVAWGDVDKKEVANKPKSAAPAPMAAEQKAAPVTQENATVVNSRPGENVAADRSRAINSNTQTQMNEVVTNGLGVRGRRNDGKDNEVTLSQKRAVTDNFFNRGYSFNYKVTDTKGNSIPFSNVSTEDLTTYSRSDGTFGLLSHDSILKVNIKAVGYEPKSFFLNYNTQTANVTLNEESFAKEKNLTIVGDQKNFAMRKQKSKEKAEETEEAEPLDGWATYDSYLANNIDLSDKSKGEVQLSFEVGKRGEIKSVTVEKSLGAKEDQEAIRLVTQGPKWKGKKKRSKARVVITF